MSAWMKKKILAVETISILLISGSIGYIIVSRQDMPTGAHGSEQTVTVPQDTIKQTDVVPPPIHAHINAGPLVGYEPLTVNLKGNPENDTNIVSYHWEFGPTTQPIVPQTQYKKIHFFLIPFLLVSIIFFPLSFAYLFLYTILLHHRYKVSSQYESTLRDPTMIFPYAGSYTATLTITDTQGNTSSDTIWITVLRYEYPNHNDHLD